MAASMTLLLSRAARGLLTFRVVVWGLTTVSMAHAGESTIPLHVVVQDGDVPSCADNTTFLDAVRTVEPRAQASDLDSAPRASVSFRAHERDGFRGELRFEQSGSPPLIRTAEGANCADVVRALAIVVALQVSEVASKVPSRPAAFPSIGPPLASSEVGKGSTPVARRASFGISEHEVLAGAGFRSGIVSDRMSPFAHIAYALVANAGSHTFPIRVGAHFGQDTTELTTVRLFTGVLDLCPIDLGARTSVSLALCVRGELGTKNVAPRYRGVHDAGSWSALGGVLSLHARVISGLTVVLDAGALATLSRTRFLVSSSEFGTELGRIEPDATKTALVASIGLGWSFSTDFGEPRR
jgi:hypothetical protein